MNTPCALQRRTEQLAVRTRELRDHQRVVRVVLPAECLRRVGDLPVPDDLSGPVERTDGPSVPQVHPDCDIIVLYGSSPALVSVVFWRFNHSIFPGGLPLILLTYVDRISVPKDAFPKGLPLTGTFYLKSSTSVSESSFR